MVNACAFILTWCDPGEVPGLPSRASHRDDIQKFRREDFLLHPVYKSGLEYRPVTYGSSLDESPSWFASLGKSKGKRRNSSRRRETCSALPMPEECHTHHYIGTAEDLTVDSSEVDRFQTPSLTLEPAPN